MVNLFKDVRLLFLAAFLFLFPNLHGCMGPGGMHAYHVASIFSQHAHLAVHTYQTIPGHLELKKESSYPFTQTAAPEEIKSILVSETIAYEGLTQSRVWQEVDITERGTIPPRIAREAAELAKEYNKDAFFMFDPGVGAGSSRSYGSAQMTMVMAEGEVIYRQTASIERSRGRTGDVPSLNAINQMLLQAFLDDLQDYFDSKN